MDKSIEVILVATVAIVSAGIILFLLQGEVGSFGDFLSGQSDQADCEIYQTRDNEEAFDRNDCEDVLGEEIDGSPAYEYVCELESSCDNEKPGKCDGSCEGIATTGGEQTVCCAVE